MSNTNSDTPSLPFEQALDRLEFIVHELEEGQIGLEVSLARFEEGIRLLKNCHQVLEQAEQRIEILTGTDAAGNPLCAPFDARASVEASDPPERKPGRRRSAATQAPAVENASLPEEARDEKGLF
jgi:exodeoxyribonuclease VII small subunit